MDDTPTVEMPAVTDDDGLGNTLVYDRICFGELSEIKGARASLRRWLNDCPVVGDVVLIASELAANAVLHSASQELYFTLRAEIHPDHIRVEVEDLGGPWRCRAVDDRPHGLELVALLAQEWGSEVRPCDGMRVTWAKVAAPSYSPSVSRLGHLMAT